MLRVAGGAVIIAVFIFLLSLPLLHLHPGAVHTLSAVIHWHMPDDADAHHDSAAADPIVDSADSHDLAVPFEISSLCAASEVQLPAPELFAMLPTTEQMPPDAPRVSLKEPDPRAQAPPSVLIYFAFRSPPA